MELKNICELAYVALTLSACAIVVVVIIWSQFEE